MCSFNNLQDAPWANPDLHEDCDVDLSAFSEEQLLAYYEEYQASGAVMMLYATDVLGLTASRISQVLAVIPLAALGRIFFLPGLRRVGHVRTLMITDGGESTKVTILSMVSMLRKAPLLRRPLLIFIAVQFSLFPLLPIYLRQVVGVPSNIISTYLFCVSLGSALSYALFGRITDSMGFKPLLVGVLVIASIASPLYLLVTPLRVPFEGLAAAALPERLSMISLFVLGLITGSVSAGAGLGLTSIQHYFVSGKDSLVAMNVFSSITVIIVSVQSLLLGSLIDHIAIPIGNLPIIRGFLAADAVKIYLVVGATLFRIIALITSRGLPNLRAYFGLGDFFSALSSTSIRSMIIGRRAVVENETARLLAARRMGLESTPLGVDPLLGTRARRRDAVESPAPRHQAVKRRLHPTCSRFCDGQVSQPFPRAFRRKGRQVLRLHRAWLEIPLILFSLRSASFSTNGAICFQPRCKEFV